jgi:AcrR family transcriptional regulator
MTVSTRQRIIDAARQAFNEQRYGKVTLMGLAAQLGMTKGNLWYHFREKSALLAAISEAYLERVAKRERLGAEPGQSLKSYVNFLRVLTREIQDFRFMYRDQADYGEHSDNLMARLPAIYDRVLEQFEDFYRAMAAEGRMTLEPEMLRATALNAVLVLRYFLEFARERGEPDTESERIIDRAMYQHLTLLQGRLIPAASEYLHSELISGPVLPPS